MGRLLRLSTFYLFMFGVVMVPIGNSTAQQDGLEEPFDELQEEPSRQRSYRNGNQPEETDQFGAEALEADSGLLEEPAPVEIRYDRYSEATLRALDKITGRSTDIDVTADEPVIFGSLRVTLKACHQTPPELPPEAAAFLEIDGVQAVQESVASQSVGTQDAERLFSGWMFASSPGLSALEHPVYDIWTIRCTASAPVSGASDG